MTTEYAKHMMEKHLASVALAKLRYGKIHKVSDMKPTVELISVKREKDEITLNVKNDIREITVIANREGGIYGTFNSYVGDNSFDENAYQWFHKNFDMLDINDFANNVIKQANAIIIIAKTSAKKN